MVITAQVLSIRRASRPNGLKKDKMRKLAQFKATEPESTDFSNVLVKTDGHAALALVYLQTQGGDLINYKFVHLYGIPTRLCEKKAQTTAIQGSLGTINKEYTIQLDWIRYFEERAFYVGHPSGWHMILGQLALSAVSA